MDVINLTNRLINQPDKIMKILEKLGCQKVKYNESKGYITSTRPDESADNALGQLTYVDNLGVYQTTRSYTGNIFTLVMDTKGLNFPSALDFVASASGLNVGLATHIKLPFQGFYKNISKVQSEPESAIRTYSDKCLPPSNNFSLKYIKDGVSAITQQIFGVRYDHATNSIVTPIYSCNGSLIGAKSRSNDPDCDMAHRFWAYLEYPKTMSLFGYVNNYRHIVEKRKVIIVESEKACMQAYDFGCYLCLAIAGHSISEWQAKYIKGLNAEKIYVAFDEGICEDEIIYESKKLLVDNKIMSNNVGYIYDDENKYLPLNSKASPTDFGKDTFSKLMKEKVRWLNGK